MSTRENCDRCYACVEPPNFGVDAPIVQRFIACPDCGSKRCPRAEDHENACSFLGTPEHEQAKRQHDADQRFYATKSYIQDCARPEVLEQVEALLRKMGVPLNAPTPYDPKALISILADE